MAAMELSGIRRACWAALLSAAFTLTMVQGSACSVLCAAGLCPNELQRMGFTGNHSDGHGCQDEPGQPQSQLPSDCYAHHHAVAKIVSADRLANAQLIITGHSNTPDLLPAPPLPTTNAVGLWSSDLAPPQEADPFAYQRNSILRI
jgi:hypothetical protein